MSVYFRMKSKMADNAQILNGYNSTVDCLTLLRIGRLEHYALLFYVLLF